jgi:hydrogenase expression/formation protein HypC
MCLAVPGEIVSITGDEDLTRTAKIRFGGITKDVSLACVPEAKIGQYVLVHVGMAITVIDEAEAARVFDYLDQMNELAELHDRSGPAP